MVEVGARKYPTRGGIATACHPVTSVRGRSVSGAGAKDLQPTNDLRLRQAFFFGECQRLTLSGEAFKLFNIANLSGYSGNLASTAFGQPTSRVTQVFGSGGPRAFQLAAKVGF